MKRTSASFAILFAILSLQATWVPLRSAFASESVAISPALSLNELEHGISNRLKRVEEFKFIEQEAQRLGVRAWLFGGTAAGYAHYVKWDLQREQGDQRFQKDRFDYDYTNIYRSTQDLDIVIDGDARQAQALQSSLAKKYPHLQGSKTAWEVRLLTQDMGDKQAILNNPDFMNQHTDSNSTGLIEITQPRAGESVVRDVRDWNSKHPYFLKDVHDGALHYYFSPSHETTKFAKEGRNPPILSIIRYLTKAFQYELKLRPEELAQIQKVIDKFDPKRDTNNSYVSHWIEKNGKKLIQNAVNIEYAWDTLEQLGLRRKLEAIKGNASIADSLAWWMNKEPLRTQALGQGPGKTAKELGLDIVAHETNHFLVYESITRAHTGDPNVLISRAEAANETAVHGDGFYTREGREGARGTGLTIRFHLDPKARENSDFTKIGDYIIIKNKAAIKVIPESLNIGPLEYFQILARDDLGLGKGDRGILEKLKRRINAKSQAIGDAEVRDIIEIMKTEIDSGRKLTGEREFDLRSLFSEWFELSVSMQHPELVDALLKKESVHKAFAKNILSNQKWEQHPEWVEALIRKGTADESIAMSVLSQPHWRGHPEWVDVLLKRGQTHWMIASSVLSKSHWQDHPEFVEALIETGALDSAIAQYVLSQPHWSHHSEFVETLLEKGTVDKDIVKYVLSRPHSQNHPEWIETILRRDMQRSLSQSWWENADVPNLVNMHVLSKSFWRDQPELRRLAEGGDPTSENLRAAFERGESVQLRTSELGQCITQSLNQQLK